ncbi:hypothetical protein ACJX0J_025979, partial [Zea mays]
TFILQINKLFFYVFFFSSFVLITTGYFKCYHLYVLGLFFCLYCLSSSFIEKYSLSVISSIIFWMHILFEMIEKSHL